jgi:hypothetical protein
VESGSKREGKIKEKKKKRKNSLQMCNLRRPELFNSYTHLPQPQKMNRKKKFTKLEDVPSCSKR